MKVDYSKISKEAKETLMSLPLDNHEQEEEIPKVGDYSDAMILKVTNDILQSFYQTNPSSFDGGEKFFDSSINNKIGLIDLANFLYNCHKRYYISILRQISNKCNEFIWFNQLMG